MILALKVLRATAGRKPRASGDDPMKGAPLIH